MKKDALNQVSGVLLNFFLLDMKGGAVRRQKAKKLYAVSVNFNLKCLVIYPSTLAIHYKLKIPI